MTVAREKLAKNPVDYANNATKYLNGLSKDVLKKENFNYRISIMTWARKVVNTYHHLDIV